MKILHTITSIGRGGSERQLAAIVSNSNKRNNPSQIIYFNSKNNTYVNEYDLNEYIFKIESQNIFSRLLELHRFIKINKPQIIYSWGTLDSLLVLLIKPFHNFKFINGSIRHGKRLLKFDHLLRSFTLWLSPYVIANSAAGLKANNLKLSNKNIVLFNGVDKKFGSRLNTQEKENERKKILGKHYDPDAVIFISTGNFHRYRDYFTVLNALSRTKGQYPFHYLIIGDGALRKPIEDKITELNLNDMVTLLGLVDDVAKYLRISDVFIHSTKIEGLSNAILEAMYMGLPIVAANVGGIPELYYKKSFQMFDYKDLDQLALILSNIKFVFKDFNPESIEYRKHLAKFSLDTMMDNFENIIDEIVKD